MMWYFEDIDKLYHILLFCKIYLCRYNIKCDNENEKGNDVKHGVYIGAKLIRMSDVIWLSIIVSNAL